MDLTFESRKRRQVLSALSNPLTFVTVVTKILISIILIIQAGTLEALAADTQNDDFYQCGARVGLDAISPGGKFSHIYISNVMSQYTKIALQNMAKKWHLYLFALTNFTIVQSSLFW